MRDILWRLGDRTRVMGILNVTPDSFSDGGEYLEPESALRQAERLQQEGVDILDVGGQSTRPGHVPVSAEEEWARLEPVLSALRGRITIPVSVDTFYPDVAARALEAGAHVINDVSGVVNAAMGELIRKYGAGWILMHSGAVPAGDAADFVHRWLAGAAHAAEGMGVRPAQICLDPGIGFGKTLEQNYHLIYQTARVRVPGYAYLLGASRKRCIGAPAGDPPFDRRDSGTVAAHTVGILGGADIIRVHDGFGGVQAARVADAICGRRPEEGRNG